LPAQRSGRHRGDRRRRRRVHPDGHFNSPASFTYTVIDGSNGVVDDHGQPGGQPVNDTGGQP
jgi:hypothetical protein